MKTKNWIQLVLLVGIILFGILASVYDKNKLTECNQDGQAVIINIDERIKRGYFIKYKYKVNGVTYTASEPLEKDKEFVVFAGDSIDIIISCADNNVSRFKNIDIYKRK